MEIDPGDGWDANGAPVSPTPELIRCDGILVCAVDSCRTPLQGRQRKFCSDRCRGLWWEARHPRLPDKPRSQDEGPLIPRIKTLFSDGMWRTDREAGAALGVLEGSFAARRRETSWPAEMGRDFEGKAFRIGYGWKWETRRRIGSKEREHRLLEAR